MAAEISPPSGTVTFVFTDLEGSTALWDAEPVEMAAALEVHDRVVRGAVMAHGGYVFSTAGDSFAAAFARADAALAAAEDVTAQLAEVQWETSVPLRARVGAHSGEAQERDGDFFGPAVNRAARVMAAAHGGQVLVSEATAGVVGGVAGRRLGEFALRGFVEPVVIYQLGDGEFPPLRVSGASAGNLPRPVSELVGRTGEAAELVGLARRSGLVTVVGPGGMGKTRLAIEAANELASEMADGAWFVDLATAAEPDAVIHVLVDALGVRVGDGEDLVAAVVRHLAERRTVVVLDNCEHVLDGAAEVAGAVAVGAPSATLIATSRERLDVAGEQVWPLSGLPAAGEGVELFVARARAVDPRFEVEDLGVVAELCRQLDGMPLAIELAAARVGSMTPTELVGHLGDRFRLLRSSRRQAPKDQRGGTRALRETVEWSYGLLDEDQRAVLLRLSVFASPFGVEDAVAVYSSDDLDRFEVIEVVGELVAKSLVVADRQGELTRFRMLETIRAFCHDVLDDAGERHDAQLAHATHVAGWLRGVLKDLEGPSDVVAVAELDRGWPELREAVRWSLQEGDLEIAVALTAALGAEAQMRERREPRDWLWAVADLDGVSDHQRAAELLGAASIMDWIAGHHEDGLRRWQQVEEIRAQRQEPVTLQVVAAGSMHYTSSGQVDRSLETQIGLRREAADAGQRFSEAYALTTLTVLYSYKADSPAALRSLDDLKSTARDLNNGFIDALEAFAESVALLDFDPAGSVRCARRALKISARASMPWIENTVSNYLTFGLIRIGDHSAATRMVLGVLEDLSQGAALSGLANTARNCTVLLAHFDRADAAATIGGWLTAQSAGIPGTAGMREYTQRVIDDLHKGNATPLEASALNGEQMTVEELLAYATAELRAAADELKLDLSVPNEPPGP